MVMSSADEAMLKK